MTYIDQHGRPELFMHPEITCGGAVFRLDDDQANPTTPAPPAAAASAATEASSGRTPRPSAGRSGQTSR